MLIGIAKMAAQSELLEAKRVVDYRELEVRSYISRCTSAFMPFQWTINPYRGCEIGCKYCYARYTHEFMELDPEIGFETQIFVKQWNPVEFRRELGRIPLGDIIALGTATDPYQPAERRFQITRRMLQVIAGMRDLRIGITTKSDLVSRDAELLRQVALHNHLQVKISITTTDADLARSVEPRAPSPALRFAALKRLTAAGIKAGVSLAPVLPMINDSVESIENVTRQAVEAGAVSLDSGLLFLQPTARSVFMPWLESTHPQLAGRYAERFSSSPFLRDEYAASIRARLNAMRAKYGLKADFFNMPQSVPPQMGFDFIQKSTC